MTNSSSEIPQIPKGWILGGDDPNSYEVGIDTAVSRSGSQSAYMTHAKEDPKGFGTLMQEMSPEDYAGKRLRMTMWVKSEKAFGVQPWLRIDGPQPHQPLGFDNCFERRLTGTRDWTKFDIVLDVPEESTNIAFGIILAGTGKVWFDDVDFAEVANDVPTTDKAPKKRKPRNLKFED